MWYYMVHFIFPWMQIVLFYQNKLWMQKSLTVWKWFYRNEGIIAHGFFCDIMNIFLAYCVVWLKSLFYFDIFTYGCSAVSGLATNLFWSSGDILKYSEFWILWTQSEGRRGLKSAFQVPCLVGLSSDRILLRNGVGSNLVVYIQSCRF